MCCAPVAAQSIYADGFEGEAPPPDVVSGGLGTNLEGLEDFSVGYAFTDFFRQSRPWFTASPGLFDTNQTNQPAWT